MAVFIQKGDAHLSVAQAYNRGMAIYNNEAAPHIRDGWQVLDPDYYNAWAENWIRDNQTNETNNLFNLALERYRKATQRLAQYELSVGRAEVYEEQSTGEFDDEGNEITVSVLVQTSIAPLEPTVVISVYDEETETSSEETINNPVIVVDKAERSHATSIVDATPVEVKDFV
jgi:hypothetical protein